jgi:hypothetical protein
MESLSSLRKLTSYNIFVQIQSSILKKEGVVFKGKGSNFIFIAGLWNIYKNKDPILIESFSDDIIKRMDFEIIKKRWKKAKQEFSVMDKSQKHLNDFRSGKIAGVLV